MQANNISEEILWEAIKTMDESKVFAGSERNIRILKFLVECYLKGEHVKESVLELELFGDKNQPVSYDGKVRVYMFNLRKKLEEYYRTEGAEDKIVFTIKKGQYNLSVEKNNTLAKTNKLHHFLGLYITVPIILILLFLLIKPQFKQSFFWDSFFKSNTATICCVGDHFMVVSKGKNKERIVTYHNEVNSDKDFDDFVKTKDNIEANYEKAPFSFMTKMGPVCSAQLAQWFSSHKKDLKVVVESETTINNLKNNNIIYIGPFRTMDVLSGIFLKDSEKFKYDGSKIVNALTGKSIRGTHTENSRQDYVMVSYNKLTDSGQHIIYFASNNDIGVLAAVKNFTNQDWLKEFDKNLPNSHSYFNALFKVEGIGRTDLQCELVDIEIVSN
ncbi:helix-turn-helix domain-containing protein [Labilibacter marinus]|uniref:helix-turn-helix domain-containing protein n=1 Tax=Labilibacter marinus TaxID=1477105 RepID=UPI0008366345|nr:helix-turn-helix domain-containing protein [Labilibacter marinus]